MARDGFQDGGADGCQDGGADGHGFQDGGADGWQDSQAQEEQRDSQSQDGGTEGTPDASGEQGQQQDQDNESKIKDFNDLVGVASGPPFDVPVEGTTGLAGRIRWIADASDEALQGLNPANVITTRTRINQALNLRHLFHGRTWRVDYPGAEPKEEDWQWLFINSGASNSRYINSFTDPPGVEVYNQYRWGLDQAFSNWVSGGQKPEDRPALRRLPTDRWVYINLIQSDIVSRIADRWEQVHPTPPLVRPNPYV